MKDKYLVDYAMHFRRGILDGRRSDMMCFAVCAPLASLLNLNGVQTALVESIVDLDEGEINHFWLRLLDGRALDPTIDQFKKFMGKRLPKVYLGPPLPILHTRLASHPDR